MHWEWSLGLEMWGDFKYINLIEVKFLMLLLLHSKTVPSDPWICLRGVAYRIVPPPFSCCWEMPLSPISLFILITFCLLYYYWGGFVLIRPWSWAPHHCTASLWQRCSRQTPAHLWLGFHVSRHERRAVSIFTATKSEPLVQDTRCRLLSPPTEWLWAPCLLEPPGGTEPPKPRKDLHRPSGLAFPPGQGLLSSSRKYTTFAQMYFSWPFSRENQLKGILAAFFTFHQS